MEFSDFIKILFGAAAGFAGSWAQYRCRRDEERLKLHREKLEALYSYVKGLKEVTTGLYLNGKLHYSESFQYRNNSGES